ncbi:MAG: hypothetical protein ACOX70_06815 [Syntrophaceticus schinkii]|jgi:hypothetical protein
MNRSACAVLSLLIALSLMSFGFTNWPNRNSGSASQTSKFKWGIFSDSVSQGDWGPDLTCEPGLKNARPISEGKDVGATSLNLQDTNKNGAIDTIKIDVKNAYPSYYNKVDIGVKNFGEIAVKVGNAIFIWEGKTFTLESGQVYYLYEDRRMIKNATAPEDAILEVRWTEGSEQNLYPGDILPCALEYHVLQGACQNHSYDFGVTLTAEALEVVGSISDQAVSKVKSALLPRTGGTVYFFYLVGTVAVVFGVFLRRKHSRK